MIDGDIVNLRVIESSDIDIVHSWFNDTRKRGMWDINLPIPRHQMVERINEWASDKNIQRYLIEKKDGSLIYGLFAISERWRFTSILMAEQDAEHEKAALDALNIAKRMTFLERIDVNNLSIRVTSWDSWLIEIIRKSGMKPIGKFRRTGMRNGEFYDDLYFDILREEYLESIN